MNDVRRLFLSCARSTHRLLSRPELERRWDEPSALEHFSVRGLAGHLVRATGSVEAYLDRPEPEGDQPISAGAYYARAIDTPDLQSDLHVAVRAKGEAEAAGGYADLLQRLEGLVGRLEKRLEEEAPTRLVRVFQDIVLSLDDYLVTRLIEQLVHSDDLALSIGVEPPEAPPGAMDVVLRGLLEVARTKHGDLAVLRAFARRERDSVGALRVL
jgi:hypothetical protein